MMALRSLALGAVMALPGPSHARLADVSCDDTLRLEHRLERVIGAQRQGHGLREPDALIEIWIVPQSGDWTIVQTYANGTSCIVAIGENWETLLPAPV